MGNTKPPLRHTSREAQVVPISDLRFPASDFRFPASDFVGAGGGIRTPNPRFTKPETPAQNSSNRRDLGQGQTERAAPGAARRRPEAQTPPDLDLIVDAWPRLPEHIKAAVLALVKTAEV